MCSKLASATSRRALAPSAAGRRLHSSKPTRAGTTSVGMLATGAHDRLLPACLPVCLPAFVYMVATFLPQPGANPACHPSHINPAACPRERPSGLPWVVHVCTCRLGGEPAMGKSAPLMPWAKAPKAPWVLVWLSPHTIVMPGWVLPCSATPAVLSALYANWKTCRSIKPHWVQRQLANQPAGPCRLAQHCGRMESPGPLGPPISPICCRKDTRAAAAAPGRYTTGQPPSCGGLIDCHRTQ